MQRVHDQKCQQCHTTQDIWTLEGPQDVTGYIYRPCFNRGKTPATTA